MEAITEEASLGLFRRVVDWDRVDKETETWRESIDPYITTVLKMSHQAGQIQALRQALYMNREQMLLRIQALQHGDDGTETDENSSSSVSPELASRVAPNTENSETAEPLQGGDREGGERTPDGASGVGGD